MFLPIHFVKIEDLACPFCQPAIADLRDASIWSRAAAGAQAFGGSTGQETLQLPTGSHLSGVAEKAFSYLLDRDAGSVLPKRIRYLDVDGAEPISIVMTSERSFATQGRSFSFPTRFEIRSAGPEDGDAMACDIVIEELIINGPIDPAIFELDRGAADMIWDEDLQAPVKTIGSRSEH